MLAWLREEAGRQRGGVVGTIAVRSSGSFSRVHLRISQLQVQQWTGIMANKQVYAGSDETPPEPHSLPESVLVGIDPKC